MTAAEQLLRNSDFQGYAICRCLGRGLTTESPLGGGSGRQFHSGGQLGRLGSDFRHFASRYEFNACSELPEHDEAKNFGTRTPMIRSSAESLAGSRLRCSLSASADQILLSTAAHGKAQCEMRECSCSHSADLSRIFVVSRKCTPVPLVSIRSYRQHVATQVHFAALFAPQSKLAPTITNRQNLCR